MAAAVPACRCTGCPSTARIVSKKTRPVSCACMTWPKAFKEKPAQGRSSSRQARCTQTAVSTPQPTIRPQKTASARVFLRYVGDAIVMPFLPMKSHCACMPPRRGARCDIRGSTAPTPWSWTNRPQPRWRAVLSHIKHRSTLLLELVAHVKFCKEGYGLTAETSPSPLHSPANTRSDRCDGTGRSAKCPESLRLFSCHQSGREARAPDRLASGWARPLAFFLALPRHSLAAPQWWAGAPLPARGNTRPHSLEARPAYQTAHARCQRPRPAACR